MPEKFRNKYRTTTCRLQGWDYGWNAAYFVTICTKNRAHHFGKVMHGKMELSEMGRIADRCWKEIPNHFPFVKLGRHVVMPDHVHGIVIIDKKVESVDPLAIAPQNFEPQDFVAQLSKPGIPYKNKFGPQSKNLASIVRGYKVGVTKFSRKIEPAFDWQSLYYDHLIRDEGAYQRISEYILRNPQNWGKKKK